ncbi:hypothetical protein ACWEQ1_00285 [Streptomyces nodosus]
MPIRPGTTAYQLTDSVPHALKQLPAPEVDEVKEFTHGMTATVSASARWGTIGR